MATFGATFGRMLGVLMTCSLLGLAGCGEAQPDATPDAPLPSLQAPTPTPSSSPSAMPSTKPETAKEFLRRWPVVETEMINTGETAEYRELTKGCRPCDGLADQIEGFYANGGYAETTGWGLVSMTRVGEIRGVSEFSVRSTAAPTRFRSSREGPVQMLSGGKIRYRVYVKRVAHDWKLVDYLNEDVP